MLKRTAFYLKCVRPLGVFGCRCRGCGKALKAEDKVLTCPDCAAIFCEACVRNEGFENHTCSEADMFDTDPYDNAEGDSPDFNPEPDSD